jgi:hypothetical protein
LAEEAKQNREDVQDNPLLSERQNTRREKKATRDSIIAGRKLIQEKRKQNTRKDDKKNF